MRRFFSYLMLFYFLVFFLQESQAQQISSTYSDSTITKRSFIKRIPYKELIVPVGLMSYGLIALESHFLISQNKDLRDELRENIDRKFSVDDFSQYAGTASIFALDAFGIRAKHNLKQRLFTAAVSNAIMTATVISIKNTGNVWRPDSSANNSFPSGHTATAFVGAELLWQEYKDRSIWYGVAGYAVAAGTGFFRMYNNKHWLSDVAMGAGIGILSTKIAYWMLPLIDHNKQSQSVTYMFIPGYNGKQLTIAGNIRF